MSSIPGDNAATGSAINNAISRVGQPLLSAVIFVAITGTFYTTLAGRSRRRRGRSRAAGDGAAAEPAARGRAGRRRQRRASTPRSTRSTSPSSCAASLLVLGAVTNGIGLRARADEHCDGDRAPGGRQWLTTRDGPAPRDWDAATYDRIADPMTRWGADVLGRLPLRGDETVLDAGCGSGRVTEQLLARLPAGRVMALDGSPAMIEAARERLAPFATGSTSWSPT